MPVDFDTLYEAYPRKASRKVAEKSWNKLTDDQKAAALADVEKRTRMGFWSSNKKLIAMPATYLNQERWNDEWLDEVKPVKDENFQSLGAVDYEPIDMPDLSRWAAMMNRIAFKWVWHKGGLKDEELPRFRELLKTFIKDNEAVFESEYSSGDRHVRMEAAWTFVGLLLDQLDGEFGRRLKPKILNMRSQ